MSRTQRTKTLELLETIRTVIQVVREVSPVLVSAVITLLTIVQWLTTGLSAQVPAWSIPLVAFVMLLSVLIAILLQRRWNNRYRGTLTILKDINLSAIADTTSQGWSIVEGDASNITITPVSDSGAIRVHSIRASGGYAMDIDIKGRASYGRHLEMQVRFLSSESKLYVRVEIANDIKCTEGWLAFTPAHRHLGDGRFAEDEWTVPVGPPDASGWITIVVDLGQKTRVTFGNDGWILTQLIKLRLRGPLDLAYLRVCE